MLAPTNVAAINIDSTTRHTALGIVIGSKLVPLKHKQKVKLWVKLSNIKLIIIDKISIVISELFSQLNQRLIEIFGCGISKPFARIPMILCGDLYQLSTVRRKLIYNKSNQSVKSYITSDLWGMFQFPELSEVIGQRGDSLLIHILNKTRVDDVDEAVYVILKEQFISPNYSSFPTDALHFFSENEPPIDHNESMLSKLQSTSLSIKAIYEFSKN